VHRVDQQQGVRRVGLATGVSVPYVSVGPPSAAPVVLLHAWGESWHSFDRLLPLLPRAIHAVAMDLRGHGDADKPAAGYSLVDVAADVAAFMDAVGVSSAVLVGSSSGGYVAQQVAITSPHRVAGRPRRVATQPAGPALLHRRGRSTNRSRGCRLGEEVPGLVSCIPPGAPVVPRRPGPRRCPYAGLRMAGNAERIDHCAPAD